MNINKLFEGQRHDDKKQDTLWAFNSNGDGTCEQDGFYEALEQYAEHFLVKFLDIEIERLESPEMKQRTQDEPENNGYESAVADQITYLQGIKRQLTESK